MSYKNLIYRRHLLSRNISIIGLCIATILFSCKTAYRIIKFTYRTIRIGIRKVIRFYKFSNSKYSWAEIENLVNSMTGREFEKFCYNLFKETGHRVHLTQASSDGGKDLILYDKDKGYTYVECKRWSGNDGFKVGRPELQKLIGAGIPNNIENYLFITTGKYSNDAKDYAKTMDNLELWDMNDIMYMVMKVAINRLPILMMKSLDSNTKIIRLETAPY